MAGLGRRPALLALAAALLLGCAGRVALRSGVSVPHGAELGAVVRAALALGGPWLASAWVLGAVTRSWRVPAVALGLGVGAWYGLTVALGLGGRAVAQPGGSQVEGFVFNDLIPDDLFGPGDLPLPGVTIALRNAGTGIATTPPVGPGVTTCRVTGLPSSALTANSAPGAPRWSSSRAVAPGA